MSTKFNSCKLKQPNRIATRHAVRLAAIGWLFLVVASNSGCQLMTMFQPKAPAAPQIFQTKALPDANALIANIQQNTQAVRQLNSNVKVVMGGLPASLSGTMIMERPKKLRLKVGLLGMTDSGIDIGSNDDRFWIFNKSSLGGQTPTIYYANHLDYQSSPIQQTFQLQPQWLIDALGLIEIDSTMPVEGPYERNGHLELITTMATPTGNMRRVLTLDRNSGVVLQQAIYDSNNHRLAWVRSSKHRYYEEHNATLPQHIELNVDGANEQTTTLSVQFTSHTINSLYADPSSAWSMPTPRDVPQIDITRVDPSVLQSITAAPSNGIVYPEDERRRPFQLGKLRGFDFR